MKKCILCTAVIVLSGLSNLASAAVTIDANAQLKNMPKFLYQLVNGTSDATYAGGNGGPTDNSGRPSGFIGIVRMITGADSLGGGLASCGYTACSSIPATGSCSMTDAEGTFAMTFATPTKVIPTGHTGANGSSKYDKRVAVAINGTNFLAIEFNCSSTVGWLRLASPDGVVGGSTANARHIEMYYDTNSATATKLDMAMYYDQDANNKEYFQAKFQTDSANTFDLWITRAAKESGTINSFRVGMRGNSSTKIATAFLLFQENAWDNTATGHADNDNLQVSSGGAGDVMCIDYSSTTPSAVNGSCGGLSINAPGSLLINSGGDMSINSSVVNVSSSMTGL